MAENHLYDVDNFGDTISRLSACREAGADVAYAPGLAGLGDIARVVDEVAEPVNILALPDGPPSGGSPPQACTGTALPADLRRAPVTRLRAAGDRPQGASPRSPRVHLGGAGWRRPVQRSPRRTDGTAGNRSARR